MEQTDQKITLNEKEVTREELLKEQQQTPPNQKIVEVTPNNYRRLTKLQE